MTLICQKPGMFLRLSSAKNSARTRHIFFERLGPKYRATKCLTFERLATPTTAAPIAAKPAIALRRIAADILRDTRVGSVVVKAG